MIFHSVLSTNECSQKLQAAIDESYWYGSHSVIGTIQPTKFNLRRRHSFFYVSSSMFSVLRFDGVLREDASGTIIEGHFKTGLLMKMFLAFWIVCVIPLSLTLPVWWHISGEYYPFAIFTLATVGVIAIVQFQDSRDKKYLQKFIERALNAHRVVRDGVEL